MALPPLLIRLLIPVAFLLTLRGAAQAQRLSAFRHYTFISGFPQNTVQAICQDAKGYIWVGTESGLNKYDGRRIISYKTGWNGNFWLNSKSINNIVNGPAQSLLIGTEQGMNWLKPDADSAGNVYYKIKSDQVNASRPGTNLETILPLSDGLIALGYRPGISLFDPGKNRLLVPFAIRAGDGQLVKPFVVTLLENRQHDLVAVSNKHGIFWLNRQLQTLRHLPPGAFGADPNLALHGAVQTSNGIFFIASNQGLFRFDPATNLPVKLTGPAGSNLGTLQFNCLSADSFRHLVLAGSNTSGVFTFTEDGILVDQLMDNAASRKLQSNNIFYLLTDPKGLGYWVGNGKGMIKFFTAEDQFFSAPVTDADGSPMRVYPVYTEDNRTVLIGTEKKIVRFNVSQHTTEEIPLPKKGDLRFNYICNTGNHQLFFCTKQGLYWSAGVNEPIQTAASRYPELGILDSLNILCAVRINPDEILFGTRAVNGGGLFRWNERMHQVKMFRANSKDSTSLPGNTVNYLARSPQGEILVCTNNGLAVFDTHTEQFKNPLPAGTGGLSYPQVNAILAEADTWWIGTYGGGLNRYDRRTGKITVIAEKDGLANNDIYAVLRGRPDQLWLSTNKGVALLNTVTGTIRNYDEADGLINNEFNRTSFYQLRDTIYFGGIAGFSFFNTNTITAYREAPAADIGQISLLTGGNEIPIFPDADQRISLDYRQNSLKFYLSSPFYINAAKTTFQYRMDELAGNWINNGTSNELILSQIRPGYHTLKLRSVSSEGVQSNNEHTLYIYVRPPWYKQWWFQVLLGLTIAALLFALYSLRLRQIRREHRIRNQVASDLHDDLGSTLNSVQVYASLANMESPQAKYPPLIRHSIQEAITGIRDIIWVLDDSKDSVEQLVDRLHQFAAPVCEAKNIRFVTALSDGIRHTSLDQRTRRNIYLLLKEAVNNAVKYAGADTISLDVSAKNNKPEFVLADNGCGFDAATAVNGNGLKNMKRRAEEINFRLLLSTGPDQGTSICITRF